MSELQVFEVSVGGKQGTDETRLQVVFKGSEKPNYDLSELVQILGKWCEVQNSIEDTDTSDTHDEVNNPAHYTQGGIECIDAIEAALTPEEFRGFLKGQVFKYLWRSNHKGGLLTDVRKAQWYQNRLIDKVLKLGGNTPT